MKYWERQGIIHNKTKSTMQRANTVHTPVNDEGDNQGAVPGA
jgi:hypothetical protein